MKENLVDKIKLMMFYDMSKTLVENKKVNGIIEEQEINEINPVDAEDAAQTLKNIGTGGRKAATAIADDIVSTMSRGGEGGEAIHIIGKNNNLIPVADGNELLNALKSGTIDAQNLARVNKGILKSAAVTDTNILRNIASDVIYEPNFIKKYGKEYGKVNGEAKVRKLLQDNGYTKNAIDEIVKKIKLDQNYGLKVRKVTGTRGAGGSTKGGVGTPEKPNLPKSDPSLEQIKPDDKNKLVQIR